MSRSSRKRRAAGSAGSAGSAETNPAPPSADTAAAGVPERRGLRDWTRDHRIELSLFAATFFVLACFSGPRFLRQSAAPHFIYQAQAWLSGRIDLDPEVLPNLEDWACVRLAAGPGGVERVRCAAPPQPTDRWYVSFPPIPAVVMLPFVALHGYQFNDTSFGVAVGALAVLLAFLLLRRLSRAGESSRSAAEDAGLALTFGFGTLFFYCAIRGEVWFSAEVMGAAFTFLYASASLRARQPFRAGVLYALATLTRTPLAFAGVFFLLEALVPGGEESRRAQLEALRRDPWPALRKLGRFALGAGPLALAAAVYNTVRFGRPGEFGHSFLFNNRVNADIDRFGLFDWSYLPRNLSAAFFKLPLVQLDPFRLGYDPHGLSLLLTLPWLVLLFVPRERSRLQLPLWITVAACALPGLLYQNTGYMQFGFRFSLDYTPYLLALLAVSGWRFSSWPLRLTVGLGVLVNFWGAVAFHGYTEVMRGG